jgi:hypothetical protein
MQKTPAEGSSHTNFREEQSTTISGETAMRISWDFLEEPIADFMEILLTFHIFFLLNAMSYFSLNHGISMSIQSPLINEDLMVSFYYYYFNSL